jgi:hypothetical protein
MRSGRLLPWADMRGVRDHHRSIHTVPVSLALLLEDVRGDTSVPWDVIRRTPASPLGRYELYIPAGPDEPVVASGSAFAPRRPG